MNRSTADNSGAAETQCCGAAARLRGLVPGLALFAAGIALGAWWISRAPSSVPAAPVNPVASGLSEATRAVLQRLDSPVEIRFYSMLDSGTVDSSGREFSGRVDQLLSQYEQEAGGKIKVVRVNSMSSASANAAMADGIRSFNIDKGDACYLGIAVVHGSRKESLASLAPEWEPALESDLSRAIAGVGAAAGVAQAAAAVDAATLDAVRQAIPNLATVSVEDGSRALRAAAMARLAQASKDMPARVKQAEEHYQQAQDSASEAEKEAASKELHQVQQEQARKLTEIALEAKAQQEALQQLKAAGH
jgi:hypothetical protein